MSTILALTLSIAAAATDVTPRTPGKPADAKVPSPTDGTRPRTFHAITGDVRRALLAEAEAQSDVTRYRAVEQLAPLYRELLRDPRWRKGNRLDQLRGKIRARLVRIKQEIQQSLRRQDGANRESPAQPIASDPSTRARDGQAESTMNGYRRVGFRGGGAVANAQGQALVDLIERTISPDVWEVNGGPATIVYYAPRHALVVRAPGEIHPRVGQLLRDLRRAGGP